MRMLQQNEGIGIIFPSCFFANVSIKQFFLEIEVHKINLFDLNRSLNIYAS